MAINSRGHRSKELSDWIAARSCAFKIPLVTSVRSYLDEAAKHQHLSTPRKRVVELVQQSKAPDKLSAGVTDAYSVSGGVKHLDRKKSPGAYYFQRDDGAWFDFSMVASGEVLLAYTMEIRLQDERWFRVDLNPSDHNNAAQHLRSHCHPMGTDPNENHSLALPFPRLTPLELLDLAVFGFREKTG